MKKILLLLAGFPGTGKSYLCESICERYPELKIVSPDVFREEMWDKYGYDNQMEKDQLIQKAWQSYYEGLGKYMKDGLKVISDYPFSEKQKSKLEELTKRYDYQVVTIRLTADLEVLYQRQRQRDLDPGRHLGHILTSYHKGQVMGRRTQADALLTQEEFLRRCTTRGYGEFSLGKLLTLDVTDFKKADYHKLQQDLAACMEDT